MTLADAILAVVVVIAGIAVFAPGRRTFLRPRRPLRFGLVVGARVADQIHWGTGAGRQVLAVVVLLGFGAIGLAGGQLPTRAPSQTQAAPPGCLQSFAGVAAALEIIGKNRLDTARPARSVDS